MSDDVPSVLQRTLDLIEAEHFWKAAEMCRAQMTHRYGSEWNIACQACEIALQRRARELNPEIGK